MNTRPIRTLQWAILATVLVIAVLDASVVRSQRIMMGATRQQLQKELSRHPTKFETHERTVTIEHFDLHGMKGMASFMFDHDRLVTFQWLYPNDGVKHGMTDQDAVQYGIVLRGLQKDWGTGKTRPSAYYANVQECSWESPISFGNTSYTFLHIKITMMDRAFIQTMTR